MTIDTVNKIKFELRSVDGALMGILEYQNNHFSEGIIILALRYTVQLIAIGVWVTIFEEGTTEKILTNIKVCPGDKMVIRKFYKRKKFTFEKSGNGKLRFALFNENGDELLTLEPEVNWEKESHDFVLQLNDDFEKECEPFLILHALHCANCSLSMMNGGKGTDFS
jgi:hypothetical protein